MPPDPARTQIKAPGSVVGAAFQAGHAGSIPVARSARSCWWKTLFPAFSELGAGPASSIIQGDGLSAAEKVFFGDQEASFDVDGQVLLVKVPDGAGTVEGADSRATSLASPSSPRAVCLGYRLRSTHSGSVSWEALHQQRREVNHGSRRIRKS